MPRTIEVLLASISLLIVTPILLVIAAVLWITQGRPVLFSQYRSGMNGRNFKLYKFRTMTDAENGHGQLLPDAERTTTFGRILRRTRLDELIQLWHIIRGDMSFVGPRPVLPETITRFGELGRRRGGVRPGLTGWAQINGNALLDHEAKMAMDVWYADHRSIAGDLRIILKTLGVVLFGERVRSEHVERARDYALAVQDR